MKGSLRKSFPMPRRVHRYDHGNHDGRDRATGGAQGRLGSEPTSPRNPRPMPGRTDRNRAGSRRTDSPGAARPSAASVPSSPRPPRSTGSTATTGSPPVARTASTGSSAPPVRSSASAPPRPARSPRQNGSASLRTHFLLWFGRSLRGHLTTTRLHLNFALELSKEVGPPHSSSRTWTLGARDCCRGR